MEHEGEVLVFLVGARGRRPQARRELDEVVSGDRQEDAFGELLTIGEGKIEGVVIHPFVQRRRGVSAQGHAQPRRQRPAVR